jgi:hypothetical protein
VAIKAPLPVRAGQPKTGPSRAHLDSFPAIAHSGDTDDVRSTAGSKWPLYGQCPLDADSLEQHWPRTALKNGTTSYCHTSSGSVAETEADRRVGMRSRTTNSGSPVQRSHLTVLGGPPGILENIVRRIHLVAKDWRLIRPSGGSSCGVNENSA